MSYDNRDEDLERDRDRDAFWVLGFIFLACAILLTFISVAIYYFFG